MENNSSKFKRFGGYFFICFWRIFIYFFKEYYYTHELSKVSFAPHNRVNEKVILLHVLFILCYNLLQIFRSLIFALMRVHNTREKDIT